MTIHWEGLRDGIADAVAQAVSEAQGEANRLGRERDELREELATLRGTLAECEGDYQNMSMRESQQAEEIARLKKDEKVFWAGKRALVREHERLREDVVRAQRSEAKCRAALEREQEKVMLLDAILERALVAEDPDEWARDAIDLRAALRVPVPPSAPVEPTA